jgi:DNA-binding winged helix-turn-helix (wHTH) protein/Tol biopolymer transport system component
VIKDPSQQHSYVFAEFRLDPVRRVLLKEGQPVSLNPKAFEVLLTLVERRAEVLSKDDLLNAVWPDQIVEENNLTVQVSALRKALGDQKALHQFIVTIPGRGYRFIADVKEDNLSDALILERHSVTHITVEDDDSSSEAPTSRPLSAPTTNRRLAKIVAATAAIVVVAVGSLFLYRRLESKKTVAAFSQFEIKRQTNTGQVLIAAVSPDGRHVTFAQSESDGQSLWLRHVPTGSQTRIVDAKPAKYWGLTFTPDNNYIYATTFEKSQADPILSKIRVLGDMVERVSVVTNAGVSFSPDGKRMAYVVSSSSSGGSILWTANADGSDKKFVAVQKDPNYFGMQSNTVAWSPRNDTIACTLVENGDNGLEMSVVGYDIRDANARRLTTGRWNIITGVAWAADASGLIVTGNMQPGVPSQLWFVSASDGHVRQITNDLSDYKGVSVAASGAALMTVKTEVASSIWTAPLANEALTSDFKQEFSEVGHIPAISFDINDDITYLSSSSGSQELWVLPMGQSRVRQLTSKAMLSDFVLSPDGRYIVVVSNRGGSPNLWRTDKNGLDLKQLTNGDGEVRPRFANDGQTVFFQKGFGDVLSSVWRVSIEGDQVAQVTTPHQIFPDVSADGKQVIYSYMDRSASDAGQWRLGLAKIEDGKQIANFTLPESVTNRLTRWMPSGVGVVYINTVGGVSNLWFQPIAGGDARPLTSFSTHEIESFDVSRDGRRVATVRTQRTSDAVLVIDGN